MHPALLTVALLCAQELEPRRWTHLPVGTNIAGVGYLHTDGDLDVEPALRIEEAEVELHTVVASYSRYFGLAGWTARLDAKVPLHYGVWDGLLNGEPTTVRRDGLSDPVLRFSLSFAGAPALEGEDFRAYRQAHPDRAVIGAGLALRVPLGEYMDDKLINLGENRFTLEPQLGAVQHLGPWSFELTGSASFYSANDDFFGGNRLEQDPLWALQAHVVRSFEPGLWVAAGAAYGRAGETEINGEGLDDERGRLLYGLSAGVSAASTHAIRVGYLRQESFRNLGGDSHSLLLTWAIVF
ncbi:MAG TPA: transporter [Planctomycetota bacterium]